jgi:hypothetical protein
VGVCFKKYRTAFAGGATFARRLNELEGSIELAAKTLECVFWLERSIPSFFSARLSTSFFGVSIVNPVRQ